MRSMKFNSSQLQDVYERNLVAVTGSPTDQREVAALMAVYDWARLIEGEDSEGVREVVAFLVSAQLRPALRSWYRHCGDDMNPIAIQFRSRLNELTGEQLGR